MVEKTPYHGLDDYAPGDDNWDHSDLVREVDEVLELRDTLANRPDPANVDIPAGAKFIVDDPGAASHGEVYRFDDTSGSWDLDDRQVSALSAGTLNNADLANASAGQVPEAQGDGTLSMSPVSGGIWTEDGTTTNTDGTATATYTLSNSYDLVLVQAELTNQGSTDSPITVRVNGDSGSNYSFDSSDGTATTAATEWQGVGYINSGVSEWASFQVGGRWNRAAWIRGPGWNVVEGSALVQGTNENVTSPLSSVTFYGSGTGDLDATITVFGRDL